MATQDRLGRTHFARTVARAIEGAEPSVGAVFAICGDWGAGKTWTGEKVLEELRDARQVVKFEPWMLSGSEALTGQFFSTLGSAIGNRDFDTGRAKAFVSFYEYAQSYAMAAGYAVLVAKGSGIAFASSAWLGLEYIAKVLGVAKSLWAKRTHVDLQTAKEKVTRDLREIETPILIVIDDIDRLCNEEIRILFKLIKACADFPNLQYLLLFQRAQVELALGADTENGRKFLDKIVTNPLDLPFIRDKDLLSELESSLEDVTRHATDESSKQRIKVVLTEIIGRRIETLRSVERFAAGATTMAAGLAAGSDINYDPSDLLALEFLRAFEPRIYAEITTPEDWQDFLERYMSRDKGEPPAWLTRITSLLPAHEKEKKLAIKALEHLRPDLDFKTGASKDMVRPLTGWGKRFHLGTWRPAYLGFDPLQALLPESKWSQIKIALEQDQSATLNWLFELTTIESGAYLGLQDRVSELSSLELSRFLGLLFSEADKMFQTVKNLNRALGGLNQFTFLAESVLSEIDLRDDAIKTFESTAAESGALVLPAKLIAYEYISQENTLNGYWSDRKELEPLVDVWRSKLTEIVRSDTFASLPYAYPLRIAWFRLVSDQVANDYLDAVYADPEQLVKFLETMPEYDQNTSGMSPMDLKDPKRDAIMSLNESNLGPVGKTYFDGYWQQKNNYDLIERAMRRRRR